MPILKEYRQFRLCQDLYYKFALTVGDTIPVNTTLEFLTKYQYTLKNHPIYTHKMFQTAMEASYYKKRFKNTELEDFFGGRINVADPYQQNGGFSDMSTVNTLLLLDVLIRNGYFKDRPITAYSTPLQYQTPEYTQRQQTCAHTYVQDSKAVSNNTNADIRISGRIYDFKDTERTATAQSHIYPWTYEKVQTHSEQHLRSLLDNLKTRVAWDSYQEHKRIVQMLSKICNDTSLTWPQKNAVWNNFIQKIFDNIPKDYPLPMVIQMTHQPYFPQYPKGLEKVRISPDTIDNHMLTRRAIAGVCATFGAQHMQRAAVATEGAISFDILSPKEELD